MVTWQIVVLAVIVLLPLLLLVDFYPHRERLDARGQPLERTWDRQHAPTVDTEDGRH